MANVAETFNAADISSPAHYAPSHTALLLLDFHTMFVEKAGGAGAPAALQVAANMRRWAKSKGIPVVHALIDIDGTPYPTCKNAARFTGTLAAMKAGGGDEPAVLLDGGDADVTFIRQPGLVSALKSPGLVEYLAEKGIKSLLLTGLSTSGCVTRTALAATDAEFVVTTVSDACADAGQGVHEMMVGKILSNRGYVVTAAEFQEGYGKVLGSK